MRRAGRPVLCRDMCGRRRRRLLPGRDARDAQREAQTLQCHTQPEPPGACASHIGSGNGASKASKAAPPPTARSHHARSEARRTRPAPARSQAARGCARGRSATVGLPVGRGGRREWNRSGSACDLARRRGRPRSRVTRVHQYRFIQSQLFFGGSRRRASVACGAAQRVASSLRFFIGCCSFSSIQASGVTRHAISQPAQTAHCRCVASLASSNGSTRQAGW